jgi:hypothetical protein
MGMSAFFASTEEKIAVQNLGTLFISYSVIWNADKMNIDFCLLHFFFKSTRMNKGSTYVFASLNEK